MNIGVADEFTEELHKIGRRPRKVLVEIAADTNMGIVRVENIGTVLG